MSWPFGIATYVVIWWTALFAVLPWGIKPAEEDDLGHGAGAPRNPRLWQKAVVTSVVAAIIWLGVDWVVTHHLINFRS
jgi:predicted secreted protein